MEDLGNIVFYIILAIIAIAGSIQSSKKKKTTGKAATPGQPVKKATEPAGQMQQRSTPRYVPPEPVDEGYYEDPLAASFSGEGSVSRNSAAAFADEGSVSGNKAAAFADEGSREDPLAKAFATEGAPALDDLMKEEFIHTDITESEINDAPAFDYDIDETDEHPADRINLRQAVIYSAILNREEYSFL